MSKTEAADEWGPALVGTPVREAASVESAECQGATGDRQDALERGAEQTGPVLKVQNLPVLQALTRDTLCDWFNSDTGLELSKPLTRDRIELLVHCSQKKRNGNHALVHFHTPLDAKKALAKNLQLLENRKITMEPTSRESVRGLAGHIVFLRGLSFDETHQGVASWFSDVTGLSSPVTEDRVAMADMACMESTGLAWVSFPSAEEAEIAQSKHRQHMGKRYVEILPASFNGLDSSDPVLALRGLPYGVTAEELCAWFNDDPALKITPLTVDRVHYMPRRSCPLGCAFVSFPTPEEAGRASAEKHTQNLGSRYIEVFEEHTLGRVLRTNLPTR